MKPEEINALPVGSIVKWTDGAFKTKVGCIVEVDSKKYIEFAVQCTFPIEMFYASDIEEVKGV